MLFEYSHELNLIKELIEFTERSVEQKKCDDIFRFEGVCYIVAKSIVGYAKSAFDNMLLGHFDETLMICRVIIENNVCLDIMLQHEDKELWKYYLLQSYRKIVRRSKTRRTEYLKCFDELCKSYNISKAFLKKRKHKDGSYRSFIDENYGWTYKVNRDFSFSGLCKLVNLVDYKDFKFMSEFSHGTGIHNKIFKDASIDRIMTMISCLYIGLYCLVMMYSIDKVNDEFYDVTEEIEGNLYEYVDEEESV